MFQILKTYRMLQIQLTHITHHTVLIVIMYKIVRLILKF
jgi:hypothetical protein